MPLGFPDDCAFVEIFVCSNMEFVLGESKERGGHPQSHPGGEQSCCSEDQQPSGGRHRHHGGPHNPISRVNVRKNSADCSIW